MALKRRTKDKNSDRILHIDREDVEGGAGFLIPQGEYRVRCEEVSEETSSNDNPMLAWVFKGIEGKAKGKTFYYNTSLLPQAKWKVGETLLGLGVEMTDEGIDFDLDALDELVGEEGVALVEDDTYQGKTRSRITRFLAPGAEEEEERPARGNSKKKKAVKFSEDEVGDMGEDDLESLIEKAGLEIDLTEWKTLTKKRNGVIAALEEAGLLEG